MPKCSTCKIIFPDAFYERDFGPDATRQICNRCALAFCEHNRIAEKCPVCCGKLPNAFLCRCGYPRSKCMPCIRDPQCRHGSLLECTHCDLAAAIRLFVCRESTRAAIIRDVKYRNTLSLTREKDLLGCFLEDAALIVRRLYPEENDLPEELFVINPGLILERRFRVWNIGLRPKGSAASDHEAAEPRDSESASQCSS